VADFKTMLEGFAKLAIQLTGLSPAGISQAHMPPKVLDPRKHGRLEFRVIGCRPVNSNSDEFTEEFDSGLNKIRVTSHGIRILTIQVKFIGEDQRPTQDALFYLERLGDRLVWPPSLAALKALDMGLQTRGSFLDLSQVFSAEDRQGSIGVKEFIFIASVSEEITGTDFPLSWIQTVTFTSNKLNDVDDTPADPQITVTVARP
jgi:hypothetical protein